MKVIIGKRTYSSEDHMILLAFTEAEKQLTKNMPDEHSIVCIYPAGTDTATVQAYMQEVLAMKLSKVTQGKKKP